MTGAEALRQAVARLREAGVADPARDARRLLAHVLEVAPDRLTLVLPDPVSETQMECYAAALAARCRFQPVSQITGQREFWGRTFRVTSDVLDPRPETETLIAIALERPATRILDLGTGSGCILLTLLAEWPRASGIGTDLSPSALKVARENAQRLNLGARATFRKGDWFADIDETFDLIVSNPPYIAAPEMAGLSRDVLDWEPHMALTPGGDGLDAYRAILRHAPDFLAPTGRVVLEIGPTQAEAVAAIAQQAGFARSAIRHDFDGRDRGLLLTWT